MKVRAKTAFVCGAPINKGSEVDFPDDVAQSLIDHDLAECVDSKEVIEQPAVAETKPTATKKKK